MKCYEVIWQLLFFPVISKVIGIYTFVRIRCMDLQQEQVLRGIFRYVNTVTWHTEHGSIVIHIRYLNLHLTRALPLLVVAILNYSLQGELGLRFPVQLFRNCQLPRLLVHGEASRPLPRDVELGLGCEVLVCGGHSQQVGAGESCLADGVAVQGRSAHGTII